jgi:NAD(P)-dependent dehydrogenase (short-subunit alcohol dehydrogenase family)
VRLGLDGRRAVVTGASKGIGLAIVRGLVDEGARVIAGARHSSEELRELADGGSVREVLVDLGLPDGPAALVAAAAEEGPIDVLVNNVGAAHVRTGGFAALSDQDWLDTFQLSFMAAVRATRAAVPHMPAAGGGRIVSTVSVNAFLPDPAVIDYCAAKAALANFSKALSKELGPRGIRVNTVSPGPVSTGLWLASGGVAETVAAATGGAPADVAAQQAAAAVTGRFTEPGEVADLVLLLASDRAGNVTGADFVIDGGLVTTL